MKFEEAIHAALSGDAVLFLGAGFAGGAKNLKDGSLPRGTQLAMSLMEEVSLYEKQSLEEAAELYEEAYGSDDLAEYIRDLYTIRSVAQHHLGIAKLPWRRVYTTNYDNIFEESCRSLGKEVFSVTSTSDPFRSPKGRLICVHLNGYVVGLTADKLQSELKLTETSYVTTSVESSPWAAMLRQDMEYAKAVFFVGYSLFDLDIKRILLRSEVLKEKTFFVLGANPGRATVTRISRYGHLEKLSVETLAEEFLRCESNYIPSDLNDFQFASLREFGLDLVPSPTSDRSFQDLLLHGRIDHGAILTSLNTSATYFLRRSQISDICSFIRGGRSIAVVHSSLGNGKSLLLEGLKLEALKDGLRVFEAIDPTPEVATELLHLAEARGKIVLVIENYSRWMDLIRMVCLNANHNLSLILSSRSITHDGKSDELADATGDFHLVEWNTNRLDDNELDWINDAIQEFGLWGNDSTLSRSRRLEILKRQCRAEFHAILLRILKSPQIKSKLEEQLSVAQSQSTYFKILLSAFVCSLLNGHITTKELASLWDPSTIGNPSFKRNEAVREFLTFDSNDTITCSPVAAQYVLNSLVDPTLVGNIITHLSKRAHDLISVSPRYNQLFRELMSFSSLQAILPHKGTATIVFRHYEEIKNLRGCRNNHHFWLQYAISCLVYNDLDRAGKYFDTSYTYARERKVDTFQIDNHYSRFLLVKAIKDDDALKCMEMFKDARNIINRQMKQKKNHHYPFRVASAYQEFLDHFSGRLVKESLREISSAAETVLDNIDSMERSRSENQYVRECRSSMRYVLNRCAELAGA